MSWHTSGIFIKCKSEVNRIELLSQLGFPGLEHAEQIDFDSATSLDLNGIAIGLVDGWMILWNSYMFMNLDDPSPPNDLDLWPEAVEKTLSRISSDTIVASLLLAGTSSTAGFSIYKSGQRIRAKLTQDDLVTFEDGEELPEELKISSELNSGEQRFINIIERICLSLSSMSQVDYEVYC